MLRLLPKTEQLDKANISQNPNTAREKKSSRQRKQKDLQQGGAGLMRM